MECWCSGPAMASDHLRTTGHPLQPPAIVESASSGDPDACDTISRWLDRLARGLSVVCNIIDPDVLVFGGGLSNISSIYDKLPAMIGEHVFSDEVSARFVPALHGDASGVRGAARLES